MSRLRRPHDTVALWTEMRGRIGKVRVQLRQVYLLARFKARCAKVGLGVFLWNNYHRAAHSAALIALPIRRPFLFLANLCAELGVLFLKAEGYFLKLENARLEAQR